MSSQATAGVVDSAKAALVSELRAHALVVGEVTLTSGATASYYVDAKRAILRPEGFQALATLVAAKAYEWDATAVGGMTMGADPVACAALAGGAQTKAFFVRKETKAHGLAKTHRGSPADGGGSLLGGRGCRHHGRLYARRDSGDHRGGPHNLWGRLGARPARRRRGSDRSCRRRTVCGLDHDRRRVSGAPSQLGRRPRSAGSLSGEPS